MYYLSGANRTTKEVLSPASVAMYAFTLRRETYNFRRNCRVTVHVVGGGRWEIALTMCSGATRGALQFQNLCLCSVRDRCVGLKVKSLCQRFAIIPHFVFFLWRIWHRITMVTPPVLCSCSVSSLWSTSWNIAVLDSTDKYFVYPRGFSKGFLVPMFSRSLFRENGDIIFLMKLWNHADLWAFTYSVCASS